MSEVENQGRMLIPFYVICDWKYAETSYKNDFNDSISNLLYSAGKTRGNNVPSNLCTICEYMFIYVMHILYILSLIDILIGHFVEIIICPIIIQRVYSCRMAEERTENLENLKPHMNFNLFQKEDIPEKSIENFMG